MDTVPNTFGSMFAGYSAIWIFVMLYTWNLGRKLKRVEKALSQLENDGS